MPLCSIVIPVYNNSAVTHQCLRHVLESSASSNHVEVIVVDDASLDETPRLLADHGDCIRWVRHVHNQGFARSCNHGAAVASGRYLVFLNNDTIPRPGWLDAMVATIERDNAIGAVGAKLLFPDSRVQHAGIVFDHTSTPRNAYVGFPADHSVVNRYRAFQAVTGACMLVEREVFQALGGFDEVYRNGFEDVDFCLRLRARGYQIQYCPESVVLHYESISEGRSSADDANLRRFLARWVGQVECDDLKHYLDDGLIRLRYLSSCPLQLEVSPLLAIVDQDGRMGELEQLLAMRTRQVQQLLKENIEFVVRHRDRACPIAQAG